MYSIFEELLKKHNVTAYKVSKATGVTTATLTSWKQGVYTPKADKLQKIADYFGVTLDYLMGNEESEPSNNEMVAIDNSERRILTMCRSVENATEEDKEEIANLFESTFEVYLKAKGLKK